MSVMTVGITFGPSATGPALPLLHDLPYGPCQDGRSYFCTGSGTERVDPLQLGDLRTAFRTAVICAACEQYRENIAAGV